MKKMKSISMNATQTRETAKRSAENGQSLPGRLLTSNAGIIAFILFFISLFMMGGASRDDVASLVILRPLSILFIGYAIIFKIYHQIYWKSFTLSMTLILIIYAIIQLIPLPYEIWKLLPNRQIYADIANLAGIKQPWRPISLSPSKTINSLFAMAVPLAAILLFLNLSSENKRYVITIFIILIGVSALWAVLQLLVDGTGPLYLYRITNDGAAVGLFANRNHQSLMLASLILFLSHYIYKILTSKTVNVIKLSVAIGSTFIIIPLIFITGSRTGLILILPALFMFLYFLYIGEIKYSERRKPNKSRQPISILSKLRSNQIIIIGLALLLAVIILSIILFDRSLALDRLLGGNDLNELRVSLLPILVEMAGSYFPLGSGLGSFEHIYKIDEPLELLNPNYLNQAHNDWLQFIIEYGLVAVAILISTFIWFAKQAFDVLKFWNYISDEKYYIILCMLFITFCALSSVGDYPLRVPIIIAIFAVIFCSLENKMYSLRKKVQAA